jgi:hypothetical protein
MFARTVSLQLKPNSIAAFTQTIEKDIIPYYGNSLASRTRCVRRPRRHGSGERQCMGSQRACGSLSPQHLSNSAESLGEGD